MQESGTRHHGYLKPAVMYTQGSIIRWLRCITFCFFDSTENLDALREHLQYFIYKKIEDKEHFFRFWDARVLRKYLDRCSTAELTNFFGEVVDAIYLEDQESDAFVSLSINKKGKIDKQKNPTSGFFSGRY